MSSGVWRPVTKGSSCQVCGKPDWCSVSIDGKKAICRRRDNGTGTRKVDSSGAGYWLYELNGHGGERSRPEGDAAKGSEALERATPEILNLVYGALLGELSLSSAHRQDLHRRGLSEAEIKRRGYRTLPPGGREEPATKLVGQFGPEVCASVPGLYTREDDPDSWSLAGAAGLLVPVRDTEGRIVALKVRADYAGDGPKYTYISSSKHGGPGPGAQVHVSLSDDPDENAVRLTEGELKADVATALSGMPTVSIPGVSSWRLALPVQEWPITGGLLRDQVRRQRHLRSATPGAHRGQRPGNRGRAGRGRDRATGPHNKRGG